MNKAAGRSLKQKALENLWTPKRLSQYLAVSESTVYALSADGTLPAIILSQGPRKRTFRFDPQEIRKWLRDRNTWRPKDRALSKYPVRSS